jgi:hypothetical protein
MNIVVRITFLVLLVFLTLILQLLLLAVFVAVAGWYIWSLSDKNKELEARLAALEGPHKKPDQS